ncbi:MAG: protein translocase subunit SecD [Clostridiales Family XIII bacterium]|jgi:SecD/SecF fusion protein|nr:protein translocase subunit SecD [Clostridiales Family XIII bacterium]
MRKIIAVITIVVVAFVWVLTVVGVGQAGPIQKHIKLGLDISGGVYVVMEAQTDQTGSELDELMEQTKAVIERRVNEMGLSEPNVTIEGADRIRVELPGAEDPEAAIQMIGQTAQLQFLRANGEFILDGSNVISSTAEQDTQNGGYQVALSFDSAGGDAFYEATKAAYEGTVEGELMEGVDSNQQLPIVLDGEIISAPIPQVDGISGGDAVITGGFTQDEAINLATLIRAGALPVELVEVESSAIGATIGMGALQNSIIGGIIGVLLVIILMLAMYRFMGLAADFALLLFVPLIFWVIVGLGGVLTLPGIAGVILTIGMAVDANVIIFARIKEEVVAGKTIRLSVHQGFRRALAPILDSQITTLIAGVVLYQFGTGSVKGFALTLIIGILLSLFSALFVTNLFVNAFAESPFLVNKGWLGVKEGGGVQRTRLSRQFAFIKHRKIYYLITVVILAVGLGIGFGSGFNMGIDFTGGTMLQVDFGKVVTPAEVRETLAKHGIEDADIVNFSGDEGTGVIIKTKQALESTDRDAIMADLATDLGVDVSDDEHNKFEQFGPSTGKMLTNNAIKSVALAAIFMLIYIVFRFRFRFGVAAIITTFHDVAITIAMYGLFHMTINNPFIAAILTVVGYSINDTIVVFDRVRENLGSNAYRKYTLDGIIDESINQTLVRSIMTSLTTILAILPLIFIGGDVIRQFAVPLIIGIAAGTLSSIFIASSLYFDFEKRNFKSAAGRYHGAEKSQGKAALSEGADDGADAGGRDEQGKKKNPTPKNRKKGKGDGKGKDYGNGAVV